MTSAADRLGAALSGRYVIERELGRGGMATVYLAQRPPARPQGRAQGAARPSSPQCSAPSGSWRRSRLTAKLQHPHILPLFDSGEADGLLYYVMPFVEGETLRDRLEREQQLPVDDAVRIAGEVADALRLRAHARRHPSRHQAGEHPAPRRPRAGRRLRHRPGGAAGRRRAG